LDPYSDLTPAITVHGQAPVLFIKSTILDGPQRPATALH
jgi:hypothetical protein